MAAARSPFGDSPVSTMAAAACGPTASVSSRVCPPPGCSPIRAKRQSKRAAGLATRMSHANARFSPAPTAGPFTAATVGKVQRWTRRKPS
jgi:hypothetical protein